MAVSVRGSLDWTYRWLSAAVLVSVLVGCGMDLPHETGGGTISGLIHYSGKYYSDSDGKIIGLERPWLMIVASFNPLDANFMFQSTFMVPCDEFPKTGFPYELKGLFPSKYYVYAELADFASKTWWNAFSIGGYQFGFEPVEVTSKKATPDIDVTMFDVQ